MKPSQHRAAVRPIALMLVEGFPPAFARGGPTVSAANLVAATQDIVDWRVITRNDDVEDDTPIAEEGVWLGHNPRILRTNSYLRMAYEVRLAVTRWPVSTVITNSLFAPSTRAAALGCWGASDIRFVVLPRGELDPGALRLKPKRKAVFLGALRGAQVESRAILGTTSRLEEYNVRRIFPHMATVSLPNLAVNPIEIPFRLNPHIGPLRLVFNSRVSEKKGLHIALQALSTYERTLSLDIYGGDYGDYAERCRTLAACVPSSVTVSWRGMVPPAALRATLRSYDAMLLPTFGENYGHAIAEALAAGTPVLVPDTTPWTQVIQQGAGLLLDSHLPSAVTAALKRLHALDASEQSAMRRSARDSAVKVYTSAAAGGQVRESLRSLLSGPRLAAPEGVL